MTPEEERAALAAKTEELAQTIAKTDRRLASLPQTPQTAEAREAMGEAFSEQGFNEALLEAGAAPFSVVARHIRTYADGAQPAAAA